MENDWVRLFQALSFPEIEQKFNEFKSSDVLKIYYKYDTNKNTYTLSEHTSKNSHNSAIIILLALSEIIACNCPINKSNHRNICNQINKLQKIFIIVFNRLDITLQSLQESIIAITLDYLKDILQITDIPRQLKTLCNLLQNHENISMKEALCNGIQFIQEWNIVNSNSTHESTSTQVSSTHISSTYVTSRNVTSMNTTNSTSTVHMNSNAIINESTIFTDFEITAPSLGMLESQNSEIFSSIQEFSLNYDDYFENNSLNQSMTLIERNNERRNKRENEENNEQLIKVCIYLLTLFIVIIIIIYSNEWF